MGTFKLDKRGIEKLRNHLKSQVAEVQKCITCEAYDYFLNFGYHIANSGIEPGGGGYSLYYLAGWNCSVGEIDTSVAQPLRPKNAIGVSYRSDVDKTKAENMKNNITCGSIVYVTNSVWYGYILNNGGTHPDFFCKESSPNRFVELCLAYINNSVDGIVKNIANKEPEL